MSYVAHPDLKWDLFLSYAHVDNAEGWVERFHKQLTVKLDQLGGRAGEIQIWWDATIDEATAFDSVIQERVQGSALFLALCSKGYGRSDYCRKESDAFRQYYDGKLRVGEHSRIVRARLHNIPYDELPGTGERTGAVDFFVAEGDDTIGTLIEADSADFRRKVDRLGKVIIKILDDLKEPPPVVEPPTGTRSVFLAEVCDSQRKARERLAADLGPRGLTVAARTPPPFSAAEHESAARSALAGAKLVVHLFDAWGDNPVQGRTDRTYGQEQFRLAQEMKKPQLIWISQRVKLGDSTSESADVDWLSFLNKLDSAKRDEDQYQIVRCPPSELASLVAARVAEPPPPPPPSGEAPAVLLDTHERDHLVAFDVCKALLTSGVRPDLIAQQDGPAQNTSLFAERLKQTRGLIVLYGRSSEEWVRARLDEGRKLMVTAPGGLRFCGVLMAPPNEGKNQAAFDHPLFKTHVLDIRQGLNPDTLSPVLHGLGVR